MTRFDALKYRILAVQDEIAIVTGDQLGLLEQALSARLADELGLAAELRAEAAAITPRLYTLFDEHSDLVEQFRQEGQA